MHCTITLSTVYSYHTAKASVKKFIEKNQKNQQNLYKISNIVNPKGQKSRPALLCRAAYKRNILKLRSVDADSRNIRCKALRSVELI